MAYLITNGKEYIHYNPFEKRYYFDKGAKGAIK